MRNIRSWGLYAIVGQWVTGPGGMDRVRLVLQGGASTVQLRVKDMSTRDMVALAIALDRIVRQYDARFIVNDRLDVALAAGADGVHLGEADLPVHMARAVGGPDLVIGASTGNPCAARHLQTEGADYLGVGPVFPTISKPDTRPVIGIQGLKRVVDAAGIPVVAIGGIDQANIEDVVRAGAAGAAVISALFDNVDPGRAAASLARHFGEQLG